MDLLLKREKKYEYRTLVNLLWITGNFQDSAWRQHFEMRNTPGQPVLKLPFKSLKEDVRMQIQDRLNFDSVVNNPFSTGYLSHSAANRFYRGIDFL